MHESIKPPRRRVRSPWVWAGAGVLAAALIGASTLHFVTASCAAVLPAAAPPSATAATTGQAYFYHPGDGEGSCSFGSLSSGGLYVSLAAAQYANGASCGSYLDVTGPDGSVRAEVVDLCPGCTDGGLDMSQAAFTRVASLAAGTAEVRYHLVRDPHPAGPIELRIAQSSSAGWLALQVLNNGNPLRSVAVIPDRSAGAAGGAGWQPLVLNSDDYWSAPAGAGAGPFAVRITDVFGHQAVASGIRLLPGSVQRTQVLMYAAAAPPAKASPAQPSQTQPGQTGPSRTQASPAGSAPGRTVSPRAGAAASPGPAAALASGPPVHVALGGQPSTSGTAGPHCLSPSCCFSPSRR